MKVGGRDVGHQTHETKRHCCLGTLVTLLLPILSAHRSSHPVLSPLSHDAVILAFGDSLIYGRDASYPKILERMINRRVINSGIPDEMSDEGLRLLLRILDSTHSDIVILCHGGNDMLGNMDLVHMKQTLRAMVHAIGNRGIQIVLIGVPRQGLRFSMAPFYGKITREMNIPMECEALAHGLSKGLLKSDY